jgi:outer membrane usher protein
MVVRDILGRETVITQPFFTHNYLLAKDLNDWSAEAGRLRRDLGLSSSYYDSAFISGLWRRGMNDTFTLEGRAEATSGMRNAGLGAATALPWQLLGRAAGNLSHAQGAGSGSQWLLGLERQGVSTNAQIEVQGATSNFRQLGLDTAIAPAKQQLAGSWSYRFAGDAASLGAGYASIRRFDASRVNTLSTNLAVRMGDYGTLNLTASQSHTGINGAGDTRGTTLGATLVVPFGDNRIFNASVSRNNNQQDTYVSASQNLGQIAGLGWRVLASDQQQESRAEGSLSYFGTYGLVSSDLSTSSSRSALRFGARGSLVVADGKLFATRYLEQSFAVAEVSGYDGVGVGVGGSPQGYTHKGVAIIPQLSAYQTNAIRLDPAELPLNAEVDSIEQNTVPSWRSAVKVKFPVRSGRSALIKIVLDDNEPAPAGAILIVDGDKQEFYVARRGEAFITALQPTNRAVLKWKDQQCRFDVILPPEKKDDIPRLGPLLCKGVTR